MNGNSLKDLFFPRRCAVCDEVLPYGTEGVCQACGRKLPFIEEPRCFRCGKTVENEETEFCGDCMRKEHLFRQGFPVLRYVPPVSDAMAALKYHGRAEYADFYGKLMAEHFADRWKEIAPDCLVPVPVHPHRLRKRGYNQAALLAQAMSRSLGIPVNENLLIRSADTTAQKKLSREERALNLRSAFQPGPETPPPCVLLVDDIYTTGATVDACTEVLLASGAKRVYSTSVCC